MLRKQFAAMIAALALSTAAVATEPTVKVFELLNKARVANGYMDKKLHDDFWDEVKMSVAPDPSGAKLREVRDGLKNVVAESSGFPLEGWKSAKLSYQRKKVTRTAELTKQIAAYKAKGKTADAAIASTERLLKAAATGQPLTHNGQTMYVSEDLIDQTLNGMEASMSRLQVLTNPVWTDTLLEQKIPQIGINVLAHEKFAVSKMKDTNSNSFMASRNANELQEQIVKINFANKPGTDLNQAAKNALKGAIASMGANDQPQPGGWRGMKGYTVVTGVELDGEKTGVAINSLARPDTNSVLLVMTLVKGSPADSGVALDALMARIKLN
ncbi:hypothetical protein [Pseudomonas putida]|uniref:Uncharacterized protein n=1 Tax=Pseudomonas putida TaxID=303 RepID=A0A8I1EEH0_PSEPU|nr:hypothetical protein [Pseudomonas putida]MBI6885135.1 hypothetical protein [Pseudomonas putida]